MTTQAIQSPDFVKCSNVLVNSYNCKSNLILYKTYLSASPDTDWPTAAARTACTTWGSSSSPTASPTRPAPLALASWSGTWVACPSLSSVPPSMPESLRISSHGCPTPTRAGPSFCWPPFGAWPMRCGRLRSMVRKDGQSKLG